MCSAAEISRENQVCKMKSSCQVVPVLKDHLKMFPVLPVKCWVTLNKRSASKRQQVSGYFVQGKTKLLRQRSWCFCPQPTFPCCGPGSSWRCPPSWPPALCPGQQSYIQVMSRNTWPGKDAAEVLSFQHHCGSCSWSLLRQPWWDGPNHSTTQVWIHGLPAGSPQCQMFLIGLKSCSADIF